jgi:DHA2 family methylenomycin A resistance protein-like MFS transporter
MLDDWATVLAFCSLVFLLSLYLKELRGLSPLTTGLAFVPMTGLTAVVTSLMPRKEMNR